MFGCSPRPLTNQQHCTNGWTSTNRYLLRLECYPKYVCKTSDSALVITFPFGFFCLCNKDLRYPGSQPSVSSHVWIEDSEIENHLAGAGISQTTVSERHPNVYPVSVCVKKVAHDIRHRPPGCYPHKRLTERTPMVLMSSHTPGIRP